MSQKCKELKADGDPCSTWAMESGFCKVHDPKTIAKKEIERLKEEDLSYLQLKERQVKRQQERLNSIRIEIDQANGENVKDIIAAIKTIDDPESLRQAELEICVGLAEGKIDPKAGGPLASFMKHQAELLGVTKKATEGKKDPHRRSLMIKMSAELSGDEVFEMISNITDGLRRLEQRADQIEDGEILDITTGDTLKIEMSPDSEDLF